MQSISTSLHISAARLLVHSQHQIYEGWNRNTALAHLMAVAAVLRMRYYKTAGTPRFANTPSEPQQQF